MEYWRLFEGPKIIYQVIQFHPRYALDQKGFLANDKTFFIPGHDLYLLGVLNSSLMWWHNWRYLAHLKDEALTPTGYKMEQLPIARPSDELREAIEPRVQALLGIADQRLAARSMLRDWLSVEHGLAKLPQRLEDPFELTEEQFVAEVRKARGREHALTSSGLQALRHEYAAIIRPVSEKLREAEGLEREAGLLVNRAYGLTAEEVDLLWRTAPPRMPFAREQGGGIPGPSLG